MSIDRGAHRVAVVLDDEEDRTESLFPPQTGHVHRFVEGADVHRAVAEVADADAIGLAIAQRVRGAGGEREMSADDSVSAVEAVLRIEEVHRAALPLRDAGRFSEELRHDAARIGAEGEGVGMIAIAGEDDVVFPDRREDAAGDGFLPAVDVEIAADLAAPELALRRLFEAADEDHLLEDVLPLRRTCGVVDRGSCLFFHFRHRNGPCIRRAGIINTKTT